MNEMQRERIIERYNIEDPVLSAQAMAVYKSLDHYNERRFSKLSDPFFGIIGNERRGGCTITRSELKKALNLLYKQGLIELEPLEGGDFSVVKILEAEGGEK